MIDGAKTNTKPKKLLPTKWTHPKWVEEADASDALSVWKTLKGINASEDTARSIGLDEGQPLDGSWTLGENATPLDTSGELEIKRLHRLDGTWKLDGGERLRLGGAFRLDGTHDLRQRGNRLAIRRTHARI